MNTKERDDAVTLALLRAIAERNDLSQRGLARRLGVALGLANSYLRRCVRKGLVKIQQAPANRYLYYLTPKGFAEKARLTTEYLSFSLELYRTASESYRRLFAQCRRRGWRRVVLCGASDLAEIAALRGLEGGVEVLGVLDPDAGCERLVHLPVWRTFASCPPADAFVLCDLRQPVETLRRAREALGDAAPVLVPDVLGLSDGR